MNYTRPAFEVAHIIGRDRHSLEGRGKLTSHHKKVFTNLQQCRTAALGYHKDKCNNPDCGHEHISYNSCRDRHCPKCNGPRREKWVCLRLGDLLPVKYFHVVFTVPDSLNGLFLCEPEKMYNLLFASAWGTIQKFSCDHKYLGAKTGMVAVLHSWGQNLALHPHVHCLVPAGGIAQNNKWRNTRGNGKFLFPVKALAQVFRGKFTDGLIKLHKQGKIQLGEPFIEGKKYLHPLYKKRWVVYAKLPMHDAGQVVRYIGRYSHRIAISNHRIKAVENGRVKFSAVDYRTSKTVMVDLAADEFLRRFSLHILPPGFMKIRHFGILSSRAKAGALARARKSLHADKPAVLDRQGTLTGNRGSLYEENLSICPKCRSGKMLLVAVVYPVCRGSPLDGFARGQPFATS